MTVGGLFCRGVNGSFTLAQMSAVGKNFPVVRAIRNNSAVYNHTGNRDGIDGYLNNSNVARRILDGLDR